MNSPLPRLQTLIVELTQQCNHVCLHCYNVWHGPQNPPYPRGQMGTKDLLALLGKALAEVSCPHVTLTGGEPLLRPDLFEVLDLLHARRKTVTLISNGHLIDDGSATNLIRHGVALFELPLLSHQARMHDFLSGCQGAFTSVLKALTSIRKAHGQVVISFVGTRMNIDHLDETIRLAFAFGARGVMFNRFNPGGRGREHIADLMPSTLQVKQALMAAETSSLTYGLPVSCSIPIQPCLIDLSAYKRLTFGYCAMGSERAYYTLDPLGNVRPCNHSDTILGNLLQESFGEIISPQRLISIVKAAPDFCLSCKHLAECQGGCKAAAQVCTGSISQEDPFLQQREPACHPLTNLAV